jgi:hypothetical protein
LEASHHALLALPAHASNGRVPPHRTDRVDAGPACFPGLGSSPAVVYVASKGGTKWQRTTHQPTVISRGAVAWLSALQRSTTLHDDG